MMGDDSYTLFMLFSISGSHPYANMIYIEVRKRVQNMTARNVIFIITIQVQCDETILYRYLIFKCFFIILLYTNCADGEIRGMLNLNSIKLIN